MASKNKCKNCGYRFKRDDGAICPECLTSREDTMDCEDFSSDLHSHEEGFFDQTEGMSDAQKQLEQERFENAVEKAQRNKSSQNFGNRSTTFNPVNNTGNYSYSKTTTTNGRTTVFRTYSSTNGNPYDFKRFQAQNVEKARKITKIIIWCFVIVVALSIILPVVLVGIFGSISSKYEYTYDDDFEEVKEVLFGETIYTDDFTLNFSQPTISDYEPEQISDEFLSDEYLIIQVPVLVQNKTQNEISSWDILDNLDIYYLTDDSSFEECEKLYNANLEFGITEYQTSYYSYFFAVKKSYIYRLCFVDNSYGDEVSYTIDFNLDETENTQNSKDDV